MITLARIAIGTGGSVACSRCAPTIEASPIAGERIEARLREVSSAWGAGPGPNAILDGFEPFAHPELPRIIGAARGAGFRRIVLRTDGGALGMSGNAAGALSAGLTGVEITMLGASEETHDRLSGRSGLWRAAHAGVRSLLDEAAVAARDVTVSVSVPLCRHTLHEAAGIAVVAASWGAGSVRFDASGFVPADRDLPSLQAALDAATVNRLACWVDGLAPGAVSDVYLRAPYDVTEEGS